ncbi:MAG: OsmC family protein [Anaerolineaceae bacterium]|nr:OsmC family protein [Anaerolineaceae bacterium]
MDAKVIWKNKMGFEGSADSGFSVPLGLTPEVGGDNNGFRPMELIAIGIAGCTAMDVISILQKKRQEVTSFEVLVHGERATEHPKVFTHLTIEYVIGGNNLLKEAVERAVELSETKYCPAQAMFKKVALMDLKITYLE